MEIISQNYENLLQKVIIDNFSTILKESITYNNDVFNYIKILDTLDNSLCSIAIKSLTTIFNSIDNGFKNSPERRHKYYIKAHNSRTIMTVFGEVTYHKTIYENKFTHEFYCFIDEYLGLAKYDYFDPYIKACILDYSAQYPYSQVAKMMNDLINKKINIDKPFQIISRQTIRNIILSSKYSKPEIKQLETPESLYIMADEKFIATQNNNHNDVMVKSIVTFDGRTEENGRTRLKNKHVFADIDSNCAETSLDYLYYVYDMDKIKNIYVMGDGAKWIKALTNYYKVNKDTHLTFNLDKYHFKQAINHITTTKQEYIPLRDSLLDLVMNDDKELFKDTCLSFMDKHKDRTYTIIAKMEYIINNWDYIKNLYNQELKCPMESQISHNIAALFSSRPKAYAIKTLQKLLELRLLYINKQNIKILYLNNINKKDILEFNQEHLSFSIFDYCTTQNIDKSIIPTNYHEGVHLDNTVFSLSIYN